MIEKVKSDSADARHRLLVVICSLVLVALTLNPFRFSLPPGSTFPQWRFSITDFAQNVLLFVPLGLVLAPLIGLRSRRPVLRAILIASGCGICLSGLIECAQLFIPERGSNFADILGNGTGTFVGAWLRSLIHRHVAEVRGNGSAAISLTPLIAMLCWVSAMRGEVEPLSALTIIPSGIAAIAILRSNLPGTSRTGFVAMVSWVGIALVPLFQILPLQEAFFVLWIIVLDSWATENSRWGSFSHYMPGRLGTAPLVFALLISQGLNLVIRRPQYDSGVPFHLRWIECALLVCLIVLSLCWRVRYSRKSDTGCEASQ